MAKYLDELGLSTLWGKIKGTFVKNTPGRGLKALTGDLATTHEGNWIQDSSWSSTDDSTNPYRFIINYPIHIAPGETITITGFVNGATTGFDSSKAIVYSATAPKQPMGTGSGSNTWTNNSSTTTAVILGYLSNNGTIATKVGLTYTLGVDYGDYTILALDQATDTKLGGVTLTDYISAHASSGIESGIAVTPKAVTQAINNANGILEIDDIITGTPTVETTTAPSGGTIVYNSTTEKFLYAVTNGSTTTYYNNGGDLSNYGGTKDNNGVSPTEGKIYIKDDYIYIWNGTDLVKVSGDDAFGNISVNGVTLVADQSKDTLNITEGDGITITATEGTDTLNIGLNISNSSEVGGIISGAAPLSDTDYIVNQVCVDLRNNTANYGKGSTYLLKSVLSRDLNDDILASTNDGVVTGGDIVTIISGIDSEIDQLKLTVSSLFTYKVESDNSILQRNATASDMYIIYFVPIANISGQDADSSTGPVNAGTNQTYAEYIAVDKGSSASPRYIWERLGTTDVNIDSITTTYINNLN